MAHQEASRSKYIIAFIVANFASSIASKLGDLIFLESDYFNSAIRTGEVEQALFTSSAISGLLAVGAWIAVFLMFKNIYFQRMLWYVIAGSVAGSVISFLVGLRALSLGLTDIFLLQLELLNFAEAMTVPLFFYVLRKDRYYPQDIPKRNQERSSGNSQTEAYPEADTLDSPDVPQSVDNPDAKEEEPHIIKWDVKLASSIPTDTPDAVEEPAQLGDPLSQFPNAQIAIQYLPEAEAAWSQAQDMPEPYVMRFLRALDEDPKSNAEEVLSSLADELEREQRPYLSDELNEAFTRLGGYGPEAQDEFRRVVDALGDAVQVDEVISRIISRIEEKLTERIQDIQDAEARAGAIITLDEAIKHVDVSRIISALSALNYEIKASRPSGGLVTRYDIVYPKEMGISSEALFNDHELIRFAKEVSIKKG